MPALISDDMLAEFAVAAPPAELAGALRQRYSGLLDRVTLYRPFTPSAEWTELARAWRI
jgi:hypothetical protein